MDSEEGQHRQEMKNGKDSCNKQDNPRWQCQYLGVVTFAECQQAGSGHIQSMGVGTVQKHTCWRWWESWAGRGIIGGPTEVTGRRRVGRALASTKQSNSWAVRQQ